MKWSINKANNWYNKHDWLVGCNFLPSSSVNQLEMFQKETFDIPTIKKEIKLASQLGFNVLRVFLHDLLWHNKKSLIKNVKIFLNICDKFNIKVNIVFFCDCWNPVAKLGKQPKPVRGVHNSGWVASPGKIFINKLDSNEINKKELGHLKNYTQGILRNFKSDKRILMWDIYNEPGGMGETKSLKLLKLIWKWAREVKVSQPLTSCLKGSVGNKTDGLRRTFYIHFNNKEIYEQCYKDDPECIKRKEQRDGWFYDFNEKTKNKLLEMNELRRSMGFEMLKDDEISISNEGFEYVGDGPKTPHFHWETLTNKIDPERRKALKALDIVPKQ